jgi:type VI secretion system protein ImpA
MPVDLDSLLLPISPDEPAGADIRYHPITKKLREARRQEDDASQGVWTRDVKVADFGLVLKAASETLSKQSKDLQVAAWLTEALVRLEGFAGLRQGLELVRRLLESFWETVYPQIEEDGDLEMRAAPLRWIGSQMDSAIKSVALFGSGQDWYRYRASRTVPTEEESNFNPAKKALRDEAIADQKTTPEEIAEALEATPAEFLQRRHDEILALLELVENLQAFCDEKFGDASPSFNPLKTALEEVFQVARVLLKQKGGPVASPEPPAASDLTPVDASAYAAAVETGWPPPAPAGPPARRVGVATAEPASVDDAIQQIVSAARYLRRETPFSPVPYLVARAIRWGELRANGAFPDATQLQPPSSEVRMELKRLAGEGQWEAVREAAENAAGQPCGRAWLDLQRYAVNACRFTGLEAPALAICSALKALIADLPGLPEWTLADDTPAANSETRQWLSEQGLLPVPPPQDPLPAPAEPAWSYVPQPVPPAEASSEQEQPSAYQLALEAARSGRFEEAVAILSREIAHEGSGRGRFLRKAELAQICLSAGQREIGRPILQELSAEIEQRGLEQWESGETLSQPLALLYQCLNGEEDIQRREIYARICRLDPPRVLQLPR